jgi:hypothetical protein
VEINKDASFGREESRTPNSPITALMHAGGLIGGLAIGGIGTAGSLGTMATGLAAKAAANKADGFGPRFSWQFDPVGRRCCADGCAFGLSAGGLAPLGGARQLALCARPQPSPAGLGAEFAQ